MTGMIFGILILILAPLGFSQAQPPAQPPKPAEEPLSPLAVPKDYHYNGRGRRDPFVNPIPKPAPNTAAAAAAARPQCPQSQGLKGVLLGQAAIAGVVTSREPSMNIAIISAPGGKTYFARIGDALCDAVVRTIRLDAVTFMPTMPAGGDLKGVRAIERKVRPVP
jgi:hypothetical protein